MIGKAVGGGKLRDAAAAIGNTVTLFMGLSVVITAVLLCVARPVVLLIGYAGRSSRGYGFLFDHLLYRHSVYCGI